MSDDTIISLSLFLVGFVPCALLGGWGEYGDTHVLPWLVGFGAQAAVVLGFTARRRGWWRSSNKNPTGA